ncbi:MAG: DUF3696 domain-containing protein [Cetobacterium sp.]
MDGFRLKGIKSFEDSKEIEIKPITIFVGENSSGKSSLLRFGSVIAQTFNEEVITPLSLFGKMIDYGSFEEVKNINNEENEIYFELKFKNLRNTQTRFINRFRYKVSKEYEYYLKKEYTIGITLYREKKIKLKKLELYADGKKILQINQINNNVYEIKSVLENECGDIHEISLQSQLKLYKFIPVNIFDAIDIEVGKIYKKYDLKKHMSIDEFWNYIQEMDFRETKTVDKYENVYKEYEASDEHLRFLAWVLESLKQKLKMYSESIRYIGPFRSKPERNYRESESGFQAVGVSGENTYHILKQYIDNDEESISEWLEKILEVKLRIDEIKGSNLFKVMIEDRVGIKSNLIDTGYGISQILPILTEIFYKGIGEEIGYSKVKKEKILIIEQPELHLHPAAQSKLANLFLEYIKNGNKLMIETHSEHLIKKFQILIADKNNDFTKDDIAIYYVFKNQGEGAKVNKLLLDENGRFAKEWPSGFFDQGYKLSTELLKAIANKGN